MPSLDELCAQLTRDLFAIAKFLFETQCRMVGLRDGEKIYPQTQYRRVTDRRTDRHTSCYGIVRAMHTRREVKMAMFDQYLALSLK